MNWLDRSGNSVLHRLVGNPKNNLIVELFLAHPRVDVNCKCGQLRKTILYVAAACNNVEAVRLILAEPHFRAEGQMGFVATCIAAIDGCWDALKVLVHHPNIDLSVKDKNGVSIDDLAG